MVKQKNVKSCSNDSKAYKEVAMTADVTGDTFVDAHSLFRGAVVFNGEGVMEVTKVGMKTMMGAMAADMADEEVASPLKVKLTKLAEQISMFGYIGSVVIALALLGHKVLVAGGFTDYFAIGGVMVFKDVLEAIMLSRCYSCYGSSRGITSYDCNCSYEKYF
ncbi:hypothetical protein [Clostridium sp.]|uniref:P-type ATPase n=1 Tax=Clostridium sp. TaxID=1506 RepID=UPI0035225619